MIRFKNFYLNLNIPVVVFDLNWLMMQFETNNNIISYLMDEINLNNCKLNLESKIYINYSFREIFNIKKLSDSKNNLFYLRNFFNEVVKIIYECNDSKLSEYKFDQIVSCSLGKTFYSVYVNFYNQSKKKYAIVTLVNVQSYKNNELLLTEYIEKYYLLLNSVKDTIILLDSSTEIVIEANNNAFELFGSENFDLIGKKFSSFIYKNDLKKYYTYFHSVDCNINNENNYININLINYDKIHPVQLKISLSRIKVPYIAQVIIRSMSGIDELEKKQKLLTTAVDQVAESVIITDDKGDIQYVNPSFEKISGYSYDEVIGKNPKIFKSGQVPSHYYKLMWTELLKGNVWRGSFINKKKDGHIYKEKATITPVKDKNNNIVNFVAVKRDITQQIILENQIQQSQKMQAIGTLAGGIAHDFNNILTAILGYAELSQSQCDKDSVLFNNLKEIVQGAERASSLVDQILKFSKEGEKRLSSIKINSIVKEVLRLLKASLPSNIEIIFDEKEIFTVQADPTQMYQVVMNLCTNAYQSFNGQNGIIQVLLYKKRLSSKQGVMIGNIPKGTYVCLQIKDNGVGIPKEYINRIFEPYFTTKKMNQGTGLGLSVVHGIVNDHRGAVTVESFPGKGSSFTVYLPESKNYENIPNNEFESVVKLNAKILVVDDEQPITFFLKQVLEHLGYSVIACSSSREALNIITFEKNNIDLVITDMGMPDENGLELTKKIKIINNKILVILCTGFSDMVTSENYQENDLDGYVSKPFNADQIAKEVYRVLSKKEKKL